MRPYIYIAIGLIMVWSGTKAIQQAFGGYDLGLFHQLQYIPFAFLLASTIAAMLLATTYYRHVNKIYQYGISCIGLIFCGIVVVKIIQHRSVDKATTILQVSNLPQATRVLTFEFKNNNTFRLTEFNIFGQTVYYGTYKKQNDTINILENNYKSLAKELPTTGFIKADTVYWTNFNKMLVVKE